MQLHDVSEARVTDRDRSLETVLEGSSTNGEPVVTIGRYELLRVLGRGGMGQVFEAWDTQLERRVAIKVLRSEHSDDLALREARCLARVAHPNVVGVHDVGRFESLVFIAMEFVDGADLRAWLCERPRRWMQVLDHLIAVAEGLAAVHRAGLIHGDVKPGNVLIGRDGRVRIADFGLARVRARVARPELLATVRRAVEAVESEIGGADAASSQPPPGSELGFDERPPNTAGGTRAYMAPERLTGEGDHRGHRHADQYSFCVMAWEVLFGVRPFAGNSAETILGSISANRIERGRGRPRGMPKAVEAVLRRGLSEVADERWPSVEALIAALEQARSRPRRLAVRALVLGIGVVACGLTLWGLPQTGRLDAAAAREEAEQRAQCLEHLDEVERLWGPVQRGVLEQRMMSSSVALPQRELRLVSEHLDRWVGEWTGLWARSCPVDPRVRACLVQERGRFEAVLQLLLADRGAASAAVGRALVAELGLPSACLAENWQPMSVEALGELAELTVLEHRVELAVRAGELDAAATALADLELRIASLDLEFAGESDVGSWISPLAPRSASLHVVQEAGPELLEEVARVHLARWRIRLLVAGERHAEAAVQLSGALAEADRLGLQRLRFDLLLERVRVANALGEPALDELAALSYLADSLELGPRAQAELALVSAAASGEAELAIERIDHALHELQGATRGHSELRFELFLARGQLQLSAGQPTEAIDDARVALALGTRAFVSDRTKLARAYVLLAQASARAGRCELTRDALDDLRATMRFNARPVEELGWVLDIIDSFELPVTPACERAYRDGWTLATYLSINAGGEP
jgi:predicted Ser/Thr protein kinase